jgi:tryptophan-rich sensory protein
MPAWLVILLLFELVIILTNPNASDYTWLQGLRRPAWFTLHIWSPLIRLACNLGIYLSLLVVHNLLGSWNGVIVCLLVISLNEASKWVTCRIRSLGIGTMIGAFAWVLFLILTLWVSLISRVAALGLVPYLIWTFVDHLAQWQMIGLNSVGNDHRSNRPSNRSVSSYRSFAQEVKRLKQSLTRSRRPR